MGAFVWFNGGCSAFEQLPVILRGICMLLSVMLLTMVYRIVGKKLVSLPKQKLKQIAMMTGACMFVLQMVFVMLAKAGIRYDSLKVVDEAIALFSQPGIQETDLEGYFARYANNYAMTIMTHWFIKIFRMIGLIRQDFSNAVIVLQFINVLFVDAAFAGCYAFLNKYFSKAKAVLFLLYMVFNPLSYVWLPFYYTNTCSMAFAIWGIYLLYTVYDLICEKNDKITKQAEMHKATIGENEEQVEKQEVAIGENVKQSEIQVVAIEENIKQSETKTEETIDTDNDLKQQRRNHIKQILYTILAGIIFYFGYKLRATVAIALIAAVIGLYCRGKRINLKSFILVLLLFCISFGGTKIIYGAVEDHYLAFDETDTAFPLTHWIAMGLNELGDGSFNANDEQRTMSYLTAKEKKDATVSLLKERADELGALGIAKLYMRKLSNTYADGAGGYHSELNISSDYGLIWQIVYGVHRDPVLLWTQIFYLMSILCSIFAVVSFFQKRLPVEGFVLLLLLTGSYLFQMIWESATIYSIGTMYLNGCMVALGLPMWKMKHLTESGIKKNALLLADDAVEEYTLITAEKVVEKDVSIFSEGIIKKQSLLSANIFENNRKYKKNKKHNRIVFNLCVILFGILGLGILIGKLAKTDYVEVSVSVDQFLFQAQEYPALSDGQCITQTFESEKDFSIISFQVRNLTGAYNDSVYMISLCDQNGNCLQKQQLIGSETTDYGFCPLCFQNVPEVTKYEIQIEKEAGEDDLIFLYYDTGHYDTYQKGKMTGPMIEGELADLLFEVYDREEE
ncbi:MAG: hypothetical protein J6A11_03355 [Lachnospiraceae bacterium]|nr:hypothetical protein [Lachnospiraceae bacterium]